MKAKAIQLLERFSLNEKGNKVTYKSHSTQINLDDNCSEKDFFFHHLKKRIPEDIVYREKERVVEGPLKIVKDHPEEEYGYEHTPHITLLYGLKEESDYFGIRRYLKECGPFNISLGEVSAFRNPKVPYDVMICEIESPKLHEIHNEMKKNFQNDYKFPEYKPHMTLAYIQKDAGKDLEGPHEFKGKDFMITEVKWSHRDSYYLSLPLK